MHEKLDDRPETAASPSRRALIGTLAVLGVVGGAYTAFAAMLGRFLYPARATDRGWLLVAPVAELADGAAVVYRLPDGQPLNVTRAGKAGLAGDFAALSSTCPHLGCQVHWEPHNARYFCPCHNGTFDAAGKATGGPPGEAGQSLPRFPLKVERGLLYVEVPLQVAALGPGRIEGSAARAARPSPCRSCPGEKGREA